MHVSLPLCPLFQVEQWAQVGRPNPSFHLSPWDCRSCPAALSTPKLSRTAARSTMTSHSVRQTTLKWITSIWFDCLIFIALFGTWQLHACINHDFRLCMSTNAYNQLTCQQPTQNRVLMDLVCPLYSLVNPAYANIYHHYLVQ